MAEPYVIALSAVDLTALHRNTADIAHYLSATYARASQWRGARCDLVSIVKSLSLRTTERIRLSFVADAIEHLIDQMSTTAAQLDAGAGVPEGVHLGDAEANTLARQALEPEDYDYLDVLRARSRHDRLARLWTAGLDIDWRRMYPQLDVVRPTYLPPTRPTGIVCRPEPDVATAPTPVRRLESVQPTSGQSQLSIDRTPAQASPPPQDKHWRTLPKPLQHRFFREFLQTSIAEVLGYEAAAKPPVDTGFFDLGMTSIDLATVRDAIVAEFAVTPPDTAAFDYPNITVFAAYLADAATAGEESEPALRQPLPQLSDAEIDRLSPQDLERVLAEIV